MDASSFNLHLPLTGCRMSRGQGKLQEEKSRAIEAEAALREGPSGGCGAGIRWIWRGQKSPPRKKGWGVVPWILFCWDIWDPLVHKCMFRHLFTYTHAYTCIYNIYCQTLYITLCPQYLPVLDYFGWVTCCLRYKRYWELRTYLTYIYVDV